MDFGEIVERVITLVVVLRLIRGIQMRLTGNRADDGTPTKKQRAAQADSAAARAAQRMRLQVRLAELTEVVADAEARLDRVHGALTADDAPTRALRQQLAGPLRHQLGQARRDLAEAVRDAAVTSDEAIEDPVSPARAAAAVVSVSLALDVADGFAAMRSNNKKIKLLQDAGRVGGELLGRWPSRRDRALDAAPVVLPMGRVGPVDGLFGPHPVLVVATDLEDEPVAWAELAAGVGRAVLAADPALTSEVRHALGPRGPGLLPRPEGQRIRFNPEAAWTAWAERTFADAVQVLLLGPAGVRALQHRLGAPDDLRAVVLAEAAADGHHLAAHPPPVLRMPLALHVLERMGFATEARRLGADWQLAHGGTDALARIWLPTTFGEPLPVPVDGLLAPGLRLLDKILDEPLPGLGVGLLAAPDLALTPAAWVRAQTLADALLDDRAAAASGRLLVIAAVEAEARRGGAGTRLVGRLRTSLGEGAAPAKGHEGLRHAPGTGLALLRDALVLNEVLGGPGGRARLGPGGARSPAALRRPAR